KNEANMFFQLIAKRYEKKPTIITTNQPFSKWGEVFGDSTIASAIIDRLVHHSYIINIKGRSYRIKNLIEEKEEKNHE
ncbi:MAG: ATP-binding protein, partial [Malacoplasma sp.]